MNHIVVTSMADFDKMCRCCATQSDELSPIFQCGDTDDNIPNMFKECFNINIECSNLLPLFICSNCYKQLRSSIQFKELCISSLTLLTEFLENQNIDDNGDGYNFVTCLNDNISDDTKPDVEYSCAEEFELPKKHSNRKSHKAAMSTGKRSECKDNNERIIENVVDEKQFALNDSGNDGAVEKHSKTKEKSKKVGQMCQICGQIFKKLQAHLHVHDIYPGFECDICNKKFRRKSNVLSHMKIHTNQRDFKCHQCPYKTQFRTSYLRHLQTHTNERHFKCNICLRLFTRKLTLDRHKLTHEIPRVPCPHCDKMFTTKKGLVNHIGIHTGERPFKCEICGMGFAATSSLSVHRRIHKKEDDLLRCKECGLVLANLKMLNNHMKDHSVPSTSEMFLTEVEVVTTTVSKAIGLQDGD